MASSGVTDRERSQQTVERYTGLSASRLPTAQALRVQLVQRRGKNVGGMGALAGGGADLPRAALLPIR